VNLFTCSALRAALKQRLRVLPLRIWARDSLLPLAAAGVAGVCAWLLSELVAWPAGLPGLLWQCTLAAAFALLVYGGMAGVAGVPEARALMREMGSRPPGRS